ncbi:MAG: hypothetical protein J0L93_02455 [Deltaproteobacteria bacterium]|nr:hypothetical protein [Deltaproteobacteria bacterium]
MMKKSSGQIQFFLGHCNKCGEGFESQSKSDDLEGVVFKCRKVLCTGRVTLGTAQKTSSVNASPLLEKKDETPRRYC